MTTAAGAPKALAHPSGGAVAALLCHLTNAITAEGGLRSLSYPLRGWSPHYWWLCPGRPPLRRHRRRWPWPPGPPLLSVLLHLYSAAPERSRPGLLAAAPAVRLVLPPQRHGVA